MNRHVPPLSIALGSGLGGWAFPPQARPQGILTPGNIGDIQRQRRLPKYLPHQGEALVERLFYGLLALLSWISQERVGADLDLRPAKAELQKGDPFDDDGVAPRVAAGLLQLLSGLGQRLETEDRGGARFLGGGLVQQRLQPVKIAADGT